MNGLRKVRPEDIQAITRLYNEFVKGSVATFETEPLSEAEMAARVNDIASGYPYYVYEVNGDVAGFCYLHRWKERAAYRNTLEDTIYIAPQYHRQGIGRSMLTALIADASAAGYRAIIACITAGNEGSIALHSALGFRQVSHFKNVGEKFGRELDVIDMELLLGQ